MSAEFLTAKQASQEFGVSVANLARRRHMQQAPTYYKRGKVVLYKRAELRSWILEGQVKPSGF